MYRYTVAVHHPLGQTLRRWSIASEAAAAANASTIDANAAFNAAYAAAFAGRALSLAHTRPRVYASSQLC